MGPKDSPWKTFLFELQMVYQTCSKRMYGDSAGAHSMTMKRVKMSYLIGHGLGPYFLQKTTDDILKSSEPYYTIHFDETTTAQVKKQIDVLVRYFLETDGEGKVRFLKGLIFGHAKAETVAIELYKTVQDLGLLLKHLLSSFMWWTKCE